MAALPWGGHPDLKCLEVGGLDPSCYYPEETLGWRGKCWGGNPQRGDNTSGEIRDKLCQVAPGKKRQWCPARLLKEVHGRLSGGCVYGT